MPQWKKGECGNPKKINVRKNIVLEILEENAPLLTNKLLELAYKGNVKAINLCMTRLSPAAVQQTYLTKVDMSNCDMSSLESIDEMSKQILMQVAKQELSVEQSKIALEMLDLRRKMIETTDMSKRMIEIENKLHIS